MDSQSYLNEISSKVRPAKKSKLDFLKNKFVLVGIICVAGLILMAIVGAMLGGGKSGIKEQSIALKLRLDSTTEIISSYKSHVKSSALRSDSASLDGILSNTNRDLTNYLTDKYKFKKADKKDQEKEDSHKEALNEELFEARINGILDRIYAHKMAYEVSLIMSMESKLYDAAKDDTLKEILNTSYDSLTVIYEKFENYSEAK